MSCDSLCVCEVLSLASTLLGRTAGSGSLHGQSCCMALEPWLPSPHRVAQYHAGDNDELHGGRVMLHGSEQNLKTVCEGAERIIYHSPRSGKPIVE